MDEYPVPKSSTDSCTPTSRSRASTISTLRASLTAVAAVALGSAANAAVPVTTQGLTLFGSTGFYNGTVSCVASISPCSFTTTYNFSAPAGFNLQSADITTTYTSTNQNIDFTSVLLNGVAFNLRPNGQTEGGNLLNQPLLASNTLTVNGIAGDSTGAAALFTGTLSFAAVPEPATWAMMLVGFGAVGFSMRRRTRAVAMQAA